MPTNLPPDYYKVEKLFREATTPEEKLEHLEEMMSIVPKHKGTDKLRADLRRKASKLKEQSETRQKGGRRDSAFIIDREGPGQLILVGPANVGKSALLAALTNAEPEIANYPFTTWKPMPGMMPIENIQVQLIDTPALDRDFVEPELLDMIRRADFVLIMVDLQSFPIEQLERTVEFLEEHRIYSKQRTGEFEDTRRMSFLPFIILVNKVDDEVLFEDFEALCELLEEEQCPLIPISAETGFGVDDFKALVLKELDIIRVYSRAPGRETDLSSPYVMKRGSTLEEFAAKVHQDFFENLKTARLWGSGDFDGQLISRDYVLHDGDVVELKI
jgi:small GTP-binding protein